MGAGTPGGSLAAAGTPDALEASKTAEAIARAAGAPGPQALAHLAQSMVDPAHAEELRSLAEATLAETGLAIPPAMVIVPPAPGAAVHGVVGVAPSVAPSSNGHHGPAVSATVALADEVPDSVPAVAIRCFGAFRMTVDGRAVDLSALKPRPRAVLRLLALNAGRPVHREVIQESLWPDSDIETGAKSLHVALSQLRRELDPNGERASGSPGVLVREGDAYRIVLSPRARVDVLDFESAVAEGRMARSTGDAAGAAAAFRTALAAYHGELLPEDGPAEWVVPRRERARADYVDTARALAELVVDGEPADAAAVCTAALAVDAYHDPLWKLLIAARERSGDVAAASAARAAYAKMLAELGVGSDKGE